MRRRHRDGKALVLITFFVFALTLCAVFFAVRAAAGSNKVTVSKASDIVAEKSDISEERAKKQAEESNIGAEKTSSLREQLNLSDEDMRYLVLVNFENELGSSPTDLTPNSQIFDERFCKYCNRSCNSVAGEALSEMFRAGCEAGFGRFIVNSAYRDRYEQTELWNEKKKKDPNYGENPYQNPVRAMPPGKSEHETGLAFDVLTEEHPFANKWFGTFEDGIWLREHCAEYGFILRYPEDKTQITGVMYEPWHFRYVGKAAAKYMQENNLCLEEFCELLAEGGGR